MMSRNVGPSGGELQLVVINSVVNSANRAAVDPMRGTIADGHGERLVIHSAFIDSAFNGHPQ
jgi:hypothetical protein